MLPVEEIKGLLKSVDISFYFIIACVLLESEVNGTCGTVKNA